MDDWNFGGLGKGLEGYMQYKNLHDRTHKNSGRHKPPKKPSGSSGCSTIMILAITAIAALLFLF